MAKKSSISKMKYDKTHRRVYGIRLHNENDKDIIEKLASVPSMQGYIKELIREDIARSVPDSVPDNDSVPKTEGHNTKDVIERMPKGIMDHINGIKEQRKKEILDDKTASKAANEYLSGLRDAGLITDRERMKLYIYCTL